jgi:flagellar motor switch protein FliM
VDSRLVFALVETFFGGSGSQPKVEGRDFTPIEQSVVDRVISLALANFEDAWRPVHEVHVEHVRSEANPQFAAIVPPSDVVIVTSFEVELENAIGSFIVCLPYAMMEPIRSKLHASFQSERLEVDHVWMNRFKERLMETPVEMVIKLGRTTITGRQLMQLEAGDVIVLDTDEDALLPAEVEGVEKFFGAPGRVKGNKAFQVVKEREIRNA